MYNKQLCDKLILYDDDISKYIMYAVKVLSLFYNNIMLFNKKQ